MAAPTPPIANAYWVVAHRLLAGEFPGGGDAATPKLGKLFDAGIDEFVDLTHDYEFDSYASRLPGHARHTRFAIVDTELPESIQQTQSILAHLRNAIDGGRNVYVHCRAGIGRTGLIVGCYLVEQGLSGKAALKSLNKLWQQSAKSRQVPKVPQTPEQADYIRNWPRLRERCRATSTVDR